MSSFERAFAGKLSALTSKLEISGSLLRMLQDGGILNDRHVAVIKSIPESKSDERAETFLSLLKKRDDSLFDSFCEALKKDDQSHVVRIMETAVDKMTAELWEIIEPNYGLTNQLYCDGIIAIATMEEVQNEKRTSVAAERLLKDVLEELKDLRHALFLNALIENDQPHVANYIQEDGIVGERFGDVKPLTKQQRRRLNHNILIREIDMKNIKLQKALVDEHVINHDQNEDIVAKSTHRKQNERLVRILMRRSVADVKKFIHCLRCTDHQNVAEYLTEAGVVACIRSMVDHPDMKLKDEISMENKVANSSIDYVQQDERLHQNGINIIRAEVKQSLAWYILCSTLQALECLRQFYISGELADILKPIFNSLSTSSDCVKLNVTWTTTDYEDCKMFLTNTSGLPFGSFENGKDNLVLLILLGFSVYGDSKQGFSYFSAGSPKNQSRYW